MAASNTTLKIQIYQALNGASTFTGNIATEATQGVIIFDEFTQKIGINGKWFGLDTQAEYNALKTLVSDINTTVTTLNGSGNDSVAGKITAALTTALGTLADGQLTTAGTGINLGENVTTGTIEQFLNTLQSEITNINTSITNLPSSYVERDTETGDNHQDYANTTAIKNAIDTAKSTLLGTNADNSSANTIYGAKAYADAQDTTLKGTASKTIPVTTGTGEGATTTNEQFANHQNLGYLWDRVSDAFAKIDTLGGTDLANVQAAIAAIKQELANGEGADLASTLIDKLVTFLGGVTEWDADGDSNTTNAKTVAEIISQLKTYAATQASNAQSTVVGASTDASTADTIKGAKAYADSLIAGLDLQSALSQSSNGVTVSINQTDGLINNLSVTAPANNTTTTTRAATQADDNKIALSSTTTEGALLELATAVKSAQSTADSSVSWEVINTGGSGE